MKCPACDLTMEEAVVDGIVVDVCKQGCGGLWFDNFELQKVDEPHESTGESLLQIRMEGNSVTDHSRRRKCPKCEDMMLMRHFFSVNNITFKCLIGICEFNIFAHQFTNIDAPVFYTDRVFAPKVHDGCRIPGSLNQSGNQPNDVFFMY